MAEVQQTLDQTLETKKQEAFDYVKLQLGEGIIDTELDTSHYESIYQRTIGTYRQRAEKAFEESYECYVVMRISIEKGQENLIC